MSPFVFGGLTDSNRGERSSAILFAQRGSTEDEVFKFNEIELSRHLAVQLYPTTSLSNEHLFGYEQNGNEDSSSIL